MYKAKKNISPCICRCCLCSIPDGFIKDISAPYFNDGHQEVYADMLKDTFNVEISFLEGCGPSRHSRLICDDCIQKLREASLFKQKVVDSQENILQHLDNLKTREKLHNLAEEPDTRERPKERASQHQTQPTPEETDPQPLEESEQVENDVDDSPATDYNETYIMGDNEEKGLVEPSDDESSYHYEEVEAVEIEALDDEFLASVKVELPELDQPEPTRARRRPAVDAALTRAKRVKLEIKDGDGVVIAKDSIVPDYTLILFENSNLCPFEFNALSNLEPLLNKYKCFLCSVTDDDMLGLRKHFEENHVLFELMTKVLQSKLDEPINADTSTLKCKLCGEAMEGIQQLTDHLSQEHNLEFGDNSIHNLTPYQLVGVKFRCQLCDAPFQDLFSLRQHMPRHRRQSGKKSTVCDQCGKVFTSYDPEGQLEDHMHSYHGKQKETKVKATKAKSRGKIPNTMKMIKNSNICPLNWPKERHFRFKCYICPEHFSDLGALREHFEGHGRENLRFLVCMDVVKVDVTDLKCGRCEMACQDLFHLRDHLTSEHGVQFEDEADMLCPVLVGDGYKCALCNKDFDTWFTLNQHIRSDHIPARNQRILCEHCGMEFANTKTVKYHIDKVHSVAKPVANKLSRSRAQRENSISLVRHSTMWPFRFEYMEFKCFVCDLRTISVDALRDHCTTGACASIDNVIDKFNAAIPNKVTHAKVEITNLACKTCNRPFDDVETLRLHLIDTHKVPFHTDYGHYLMPYHIMDGLQCGFCKEVFTVMQTMTRHVNLHASKEVCDLCGALFLSNAALRHHIKRQHAPISCEVCDLTFDNYSDRRRHKKEHDHRKPKRETKCLFCDERFTNAERRNRHMKLQHGFQTPQYVCGECGRVFYTKGALSCHASTHPKLASRRIQCQFCDFDFHSRLKLDEHVQSYHKDEGAGCYYKCDICDEELVSVDLLRSHIMDHGRGVRGVELCAICGKEYKTRKALKKHLIKVHVIVSKVDE